MIAGRSGVVLDADALCHKFLEEEEVREAVRRNWGESVFNKDGSVDRKALAEAVFRSGDELQKLTSLLHPRVIAEFRRRIREEKEKGEREVVVMDAPLLLETDLEEMCDWVIFVACPPESRLRRTREAHHWDWEELHRREKLQMSLYEKVRRADFIVDNSLSVVYTEERINRLLRKIKEVKYATLKEQ